MKRRTHRLLAVTLAGILSFTPAARVPNQSLLTVVSAHSGRTDSSGGHRDNRNVSGLGSYHYHCGGYPPHLHENGVCPYQTGTGSSGSSGSSSSASVRTSKAGTVSKTTVKKVQTRLNKLGYSCGTADGVMGAKTKKALKRFQRDHDLEIDGIIGKKTLKALKLS